MANYCSNCGTKLLAESVKFCHTCGFAQISTISNELNTKFEREVINSEIIIAGRDINITKEGFTKCLDCLGTGFEHEECPDCKGTGKILYYDGPKNNIQTDNLLAGVLFAIKESYEQSESANYNYRECYKCEGTGRLQAGNPKNSLRAFQDAINSKSSNTPNKCSTCKGHGEVRLIK